MVSNASDDLPDPLSPVMTVKVFRGISTSIFFRLCCRAPCTVMRSSMAVGKLHSNSSTMEDMLVDVRPELANEIRQRVAAEGIRIFRSQRAQGPVMARIVRRRDALRHGAAQDLGSINRIVTVIVGRDQNARCGVDSALPETTFTHGIVALVLM